MVSSSPNSILSVIVTYWTVYITHVALFLLVNTFLKFYNKFSGKKIKKSSFKRNA